MLDINDIKQSHIFHHKIFLSKIVHKSWKNLILSSEKKSENSICSNRVVLLLQIQNLKNNCKFKSKSFDKFYFGWWGCGKGYDVCCGANNVQREKRTRNNPWNKFCFVLFFLFQTPFVPFRFQKFSIFWKERSWTQTSKKCRLCTKW